MPLLSSRIRPLLALMQGLLRTVRGGRLAPHADVPPLGLSSVPTRGRTVTIERLGARWGTSPAARDGRHARSRACALRRDLSDVRRHPPPPARPRALGTCHTTSRRPPQHL